MTLQSHPNSSLQRQWLWRWELTVTHFPPFSSIDCIILASIHWGLSSWCEWANCSTVKAWFLRHWKPWNRSVWWNIFSLSPSLASPKLLCDSLLFPLDAPHHFFQQWCFPRLQLVVVMGHWCSAQHFRHWHSPASVTANYSLIAQRYLDEKSLLVLKR